MKIKNIYVYGSSTFMTGLKLGLENVDGISVEVFNKERVELSKINVNNTVLIIERNILLNLSRDRTEDLDLNCGDIIELLVNYSDMKLFCLDPDGEDVCIIENSEIRVKNIEQLIKKINRANDRG